jgi:AcrR family transcriptional regulator
MIASTAKRPRTKPAEIRREELMDAAQALFLEKGFRCHQRR